MKRFLKFWRRHFLLLEGLLALLITVVFAIWGYRCSGFELVDHILSQNRAEVYAALATIFGSLLGFEIVAVSIVIGYSRSDRMRVIRESAQYRTLWKVFIEAIRSLGLAVVAALLGLVFDRSTDPNRVILLILIFATIFVTLRLGRSIWALENVIKIVIKEGRQTRQ